MSEEKEFDVVLHALQQHRNRLWKMTQQNINSEFIGMNIMDDIRLQQIDKLDEAIRERATQPQRKPLTDEEVWEALGGIDCTRPMLIARAIEAAHGIKGEA